MNVLAAATTRVRRFLDFLLIALVVVVILGVLLGKLVPLTGRQTMIVGGASMEPAIGLGAAVVIGPVSPEDLRVGDVVSLRAGEQNAIFTHRIVSVIDRPDGRWIGTKGDANPEPDPTIVPATNVIGRSELAIPWAGYLLQMLSIPTGVLFLVGLAATLLAGAWLLETLELERSDEATTTLNGAIDRRRGEPISLGALSPRSPAMEGSFSLVRRGATEQLAVMRAARQRRTIGLGNLRRAPRRER